jgi:cytochrome c556
MGWQTNVWAGAWLLVGGFGPCTNSDEPKGRGPSEGTTTAARSEALAAAPGSPAPQQTQTARSYMRAHFAQSEDMRRALIGGNLAALHEAAEGVAKDEWTPNLRPDWRPHVAAVRSAARDAQTAESLEEATQAFAALGQACSSCHLLTGGPGSPRFPVPLPGSTEPMLAHEIATEQLWQGVVAPSDAAWMAGADALIAAPELDSDVQDVGNRAAHVRALARRAKATASDERSELFGNLLLTCAGCHQRVDVHPFATPKH